jgi:hypothetical protein
MCVPKNYAINPDEATAIRFVAAKRSIFLDAEDEKGT